MADMIRAAVQTGPRQIELREFPRPVIGPDDGGLLRIEACGICGSDVEQYQGHLGQQSLPMVPGHEPLGIIEEVSPRAAARWGVTPGDRVAVEILIPCRSCDLCLTGRYMSCRNRIGSHGGANPPERGLGLWGGFAEYIHLHPNAILHKVRGDIPAEIAVMFNPLGAGVRWACHLGGVGLGDTVLILGCGQRGLAAVLASRAAGAGTIIVTGLARDAGKLALAREFGADHTIDAETDDVVSRVREITGGELADVALDLTPMAAQPVRDALNAVRWGGRVVLAGLKGGRPLELSTDLIINRALTVVGAFSVDSRGYNEAIRLIETGRFPLERMHTHTFGLQDIGLAIETLAGEVPGEDAVHVAIVPGYAP
jgi:threonine dehydrogenase-like Zn-dependent dehydrogenase